MKYALIFLLITIPHPDLSDPGGWVNRDGEPVPNSDTMKSIKGFGGWLLITPDRDWAEKWDTPTENSPYFNEASSVNYGERLTILTFFINPKQDNSGNVTLVCDIRVIRPDGSYSIDMKEADCGTGKLNGDPHSIRLTNAIIEYIGEDGDPPGEWVVEVDLTDRIRNVKVPLKSRFTLLEKETE